MRLRAAKAPHCLPMARAFRGESKMASTRTAPPLLAALASALVAGCALRVAPASPAEAAPPSSLGESFRSVRQPVILESDQETGRAFLRVGPAAGSRPVMLELRPREFASLAAVAPGRSVEIRYWESLSKAFPEALELPVGELESVIDGARLLVDRSTCELHGRRMVRSPALIIYGLPSAGFSEAWQKHFPHAALALGGSVVTEDSPETEPKHVCPTCQEAYERRAATN